MPTLTRPIIAFFWSDTCGHSRRMDSVIEHFARQHRDSLKVAKVEVNSRPDLAERFNISEAPSVLLLDSVHEVARLEGRQTLPKIKQAFEEFLSEGETTGERELALAASS